MFLGWYDPDKTTPTRAKIENAIARYRTKFAGEPTTVILNPIHASEVPEGWPVLTGGAVVEVRAVAFIPRNTFYVGVDETAD